MKVWLVRGVMLLALPCVLMWAFISKLCSEIGGAFWYAKQEVLIELESFQRIWREIPERLNA